MSCSAIASSGERCKGLAIKGSDYCNAHAPERAEARRKAAQKGGRRGGRGRVSGDTAELKRLLAELYDNVLSEKITPGVGAVAAQIANARIRLVETERRLRESEDYEKRIEELERAYEAGELERMG